MNGIEAFTFGEPESVLDNNLLDYLIALDLGKYYLPPISLDGLAKPKW